MRCIRKKNLDEIREEGESKERNENRKLKDSKKTK